MARPCLWPVLLLLWTCVPRDAGNAQGNLTHSNALGNLTRSDALGNITRSDALGNISCTDALGNISCRNALGNVTLSDKQGNIAGSIALGNITHNNLLGNITRNNAPDTRIVGGFATTIDQFPFLVSIQLNSKHHCGGTLLTRDVVLTASHCIYDTRVFQAQKRYVHYDRALFRVIVGSSYSNLDTASTANVRNVASVHGHPNFKFTNMQNDIAVLKLSQPVALSNSIKLVDILPSDPPTGTVCIALGWGMSQQFGEEEKVQGAYEDKLHVVDLPIISLEQCKRTMRRVTNQNVCTYTSDKDACVGDSGGPLMCRGKQLGITSYGKGCAAPGYPGVFQKVFVHGDWLPLLPLPG